MTELKCNVGDLLYVPGEKRPYKVRARDERYIIATKPFNPRHTVLYFIIDLKQGVRDPDNMIFCSGYESDQDVQDRLEELQSGEIEVSYRHRLDSITVEKVVRHGKENFEMKCETSIGNIEKLDNELSLEDRTDEDLIAIYRQLSDENKQKLIDYAKEILQTPQAGAAAPAKADC